MPLQPWNIGSFLPTDIEDSTNKHLQTHPPEGSIASQLGIDHHFSGVGTPQFRTDPKNIGYVAVRLVQPDVCNTGF